MDFATLRYEVADEIATITLNRPAKMNAYTAQMGHELVAAMRHADAERAVRVIVLTGAGKSFCAGADIGGFAGNIQARDAGAKPPAAEERDREDEGPGMLAYPALMRTLSKPSIVAINGYALGIGVTMTLPCDIRIMADDAKVGFIFPRVGLITELGSSYYLPRLVGVSRAAEMLLTGRHYTAQECFAMGLVSQVVPAASLLEKAHELAAAILLGSPVSLALTRRALYTGLNATVESAIEFELLALEHCYRSAEHKEYVSAFMEKRKPDLSRIKR